MALTRSKHVQRVRKERVKFSEYADRPENELNIWYKPDVADENQPELDALQDYYDETITKLKLEHQDDDDDVQYNRAVRHLDREHTLKVFDIVARAIVDWDMYEDDAHTEKTPLTGQTFIGMPTTLRAIMATMSEANSPNRRGSPNSGRRS